MHPSSGQVLREFDLSTFHIANDLKMQKNCKLFKQTGGEHFLFSVTKAVDVVRLQARRRSFILYCKISQGRIESNYVIFLLRNLSNSIITYEHVSRMQVSFKNAKKIISPITSNNSSSTSLPWAIDLLCKNDNPTSIW